MENKIYIVIVSYNGIHWIDKCLKSCNGFPVVVVDNASTDNTVEDIKKKHPQIKVFPQKKNLGFGQANNIGISYALEQGAEKVFLLNQDAYLQADCIETLCRVQDRNPDFGILSPIHLNGKGNRLDRNFSNYVSYRGNPDFYSDCVLGNERKEIYEVPFVNAAGWLLSKEILEKVGGFDPMFYHYGEDDNYCQRARYHGFKIGVVPTAFMCHDREERQLLENTRENGEGERLKILERKLKKRYGDINQPENFQLDHLIAKRRKELIKARIKLQWARAKRLSREIVLIKQIQREIKRSRQLNKNTMGAHLR